MIEFVNNEVPSTSSQTTEQIGDIQGGDIAGVSKMNESALNKKQENYTQFSPKKTLGK